MKAMRLAGIASIDTANAWLPEFVARHNARFAVIPADVRDAHVPHPAEHDGALRLQHEPVPDISTLPGTGHFYFALTRKFASVTRCCASSIDRPGSTCRMASQGPKRR